MIESYEGPGAGILGLHSYGGKLYAIVQSETDQENADLYCTEFGFKGKQWEPVARIPMALAASPGVVFQDKLWLMGGSSYDPRRFGDQVGYYSFKLNTWIDNVGPTDGESSRWPKDRNMGRRMGHAAVLSPDGKEIWVMGGYDQSGGAKNDIWAFNGMVWRPLEKPPWEPRCLFGAFAAADRIWIAGGFKTPGGETYDDIWRWESDTGWKNIDLSLSPGSPGTSEGKMQYCACTIAQLKDLHFFTTYYNPEKKQYDSRIFPLIYDNGLWSKGEALGVSPDWAMDKDYYSLACVQYNGCIFIRKLAYRQEVDKAIHYLVRVAE